MDKPKGILFGGGGVLLGLYVMYLGARQYRHPDTLDLDPEGFTLTDRRGRRRFAWSECRAFTVPADVHTSGVVAEFWDGRSQRINDGFGGLDDYPLADLLESYRKAYGAQQHDSPAPSADQARSGHDAAITEALDDAKDL